MHWIDAINQSPHLHTVSCTAMHRRPTNTAGPVEHIYIYIYIEFMNAQQTASSKMCVWMCRVVYVCPSTSLCCIGPAVYTLRFPSARRSMFVYMHRLLYLNLLQFLFFYRFIFKWLWNLFWWAKAVGRTDRCRSTSDTGSNDICTILHRMGICSMCWAVCMLSHTGRPTTTTTTQQHNISSSSHTCDNMRNGWKNMSTQYWAGFPLILSFSLFPSWFFLPKRFNILERTRYTLVCSAVCTESRTERDCIHTSILFLFFIFHFFET